MPQNPFLMKVLLKKEVCGSHEQCMGPTKKALKQKKKKKKKKKKNKTKQNKTKHKCRTSAFQQYPNGYLFLH